MGFFVAILAQLVLAHAFLLLHSSVLEPDFHLSFVECQRGGHLDSPGTREVAIEVELFLQLRQLFVGEVGARNVVVVVGVVGHL